MKFCPECGSKLTENTKFCPECGTKLTGASPESKTLTDINIIPTKERISSEEFIIQILTKEKEREDNIYITPDIPSKKLVNAAKAIAGDINPKLILGLIDTSFLGTGKDGAVFTGKKIYLPSLEIELNKVATARLDIETRTETNGNIKEIRLLEITLDNTEKIVLSSETVSAPLPVLKEILCGLGEQVQSFESSNQIVTLSELGDNVICAYLKIVINYLKADDGVIDVKEYKELLSLMTRIKTSKDVHNDLQEYRFAQKDVFDFAVLVKNLEMELRKENVSISVVFQSLFMDLILMRKENLDVWNEDSVLMEIKELLGITEEQTNVLIRKIKLEEQIVHERIDDKHIKGLTNELIALASGGGVALGALAVTGSVMTGAFGLSSGLIGLAFAPGAGAAALGIAAVAGAGYGAYKGVKFFAGTSELEGYGMRIMALKERINSLSAANSYIIEDINYLGQKLSILSLKIRESNTLNNELMNELELYISFTQNVSESGELIQQDSKDTEKEYWIQNLPDKLNILKYNELVEENVNKFDINELIFYIYNEDENQEYHMTEEYEADVYERVYNVLKEIGYFDTAKSTKAQAKSKAKQGLNALGGFVKGKLEE